MFCWICHPHIQSARRGGGYMTDMLSRVASIGCTVLSADIKIVGVPQPEHRSVHGAAKEWRVKDERNCEGHEDA